jgi:hypothetical protein
MIRILTSVARTTQRALNLAYSNKGKKHVFWLDANTIDSFNQTLTTVGRGVGLADDGGVLSSESDFLEYTRDWLGSERSGDWLMIVDGANNPTDEHVNHWHRLLQSKRGTVIFTSCTAKIVAAVGSPDRTIEIGPMAFPEASKLFQKVSGLKIRQNQEIEKLLDLLEYLPHAISQAASYIRERHITIVAYTDMIRKANDDGRSALLQTTISNVNDVDTLPRSIMTTWDLSFSQIQEVNPSAIELLRFMSLIGPNIPLSVVRSAQLTKLGIDDDLAFHEAMGLLASYRLVIPSHSNHIQGSTYRLHSLVGLRTRTSVVDKSRLIGIALDAVEQLFPEPDSSKRNTKKCAGMLQHAQAVLRHSADFPEFEPIRNALKYKVELHQFYAYEYKKRKVDILASKATAKTVSQPGQHSEDPSNQGILQLLSKIENETKVGQHHFTEKSDILADLEWAKNWAR